MTRSRKKTPKISITTAKSEKQDKRLANHRVRREVKEALPTEPEADVLPDHGEFTDPWQMAKDGKTWRDPEKDPEALRK